jgi:hypothetical protein
MMAFPHNNVKLILVDVPLYSFNGNKKYRFARSIYLPINVNNAYSEKIGNTRKQENIYFRIHDFPKSLRALMPRLFKYKMRTNAYMFISEKASGSKEDYLPSLDEFEKWYNQNMERRRNIDEWIALIEQVQSWNLAEKARLIYVSAFFMSFAFSEIQFKTDYDVFIE